MDWGLQIPSEFASPETDEPVRGHTDEDAIPEPEENPKSKLGDIWQCGDHLVMCGDSTNPEDVAKLMQDDKADLVWTDPPYNVAVDGKAGKILNDNMSKTAFSKFLYKVYQNYYSFMRDGAVIYVAHSESERISFTDEFIKAKFKYSQNLIWVKQSGVMCRQDFNWKHEPILYGWKEGAAHYFCKDFSNTTVISQPDETEAKYKEMTKDQLIKELRRIRNDNQPPNTVIEYDRPSVSELHPTMKPVGLVELMLEWSSQQGEIVLDLFGGSGTTLIASHKHRRKARIMELSPKFCDVIIKRYQEFTKQDAILLIVIIRARCVINKVHN